LDLQLYFRVLKRFRVLVLAGFALASLLAGLSYASVEFEEGGLGLVHRQDETWQSQARLFITDRGFPWGRTRPEYVVDPRGETPPIPTADAGRLSSLAILYAELAGGDPVKSLIPGRAVISTQSDPALVAVPGLVEVRAVPAPPFSSPNILPLINIRAIGTTPTEAIGLARRTTNALVTFIRRQQSAAAIKPQERVVVQVIDEPDSARLVAPRGRTLPLIVFTAVMIAFIGLAFVLENLRPHIPTVAASPHDLPRPLEARAADPGRR
jgi:hypothetical protein